MAPHPKREASDSMVRSGGGGGGAIAGTGKGLKEKALHVRIQAILKSSTSLAELYNGDKKMIALTF